MGYHFGSEVHSFYNYTNGYNLDFNNEWVNSIVYSSDTVRMYNSDTGEYESFFQLAPQGLEAVLEEGYQTAQVITTQSITQQLGVLVPVGIVMMATIIALSLVESLPLWKQ